MSSIMRARSGLMGISLIGVLLVLRLGFGHPHPQARALQIPLPLALPGLNAASARVIAAGYRVSGFVLWHIAPFGDESEGWSVAGGRAAAKSAHWQGERWWVSNGQKVGSGTMTGSGCSISSRRYCWRRALPPVILPRYRRRSSLRATRGGTSEVPQIADGSATALLTG